MALNGRRGVGRAQYLRGSDYPFIGPVDADLADLVADIHLMYDDPANEIPAGSPYVYPLRIDWLYGLGTDVSGASGVPTPTHAVDLRIRDADNTVVLLTTTGTYTVRDWGTDYRIHTWVVGTKVCRLIQYLTWPTDGEPTTRTYYDHIEPTNAFLDPSTIYVNVDRVRTVRALTSTRTAGELRLAAGNNMEITAEVDDLTDPIRPSTEIVLNAIPGAGDGKTTGCDEEDPAIWTINGVGPDDRHRFWLVAKDCYYVRRPLTKSGSTVRPSVLISPGNALSPQWPSGKEAAHLIIGNDCTPCCDCDDYVNAAQFLQTVAQTYRDVGAQAQASRDVYHEVRTLYQEQKACRENKPLRALMQPQLCPQLDVILQYCNSSDLCVGPLVLSVTFSEEHGGIGQVIDYYTTVTGGLLALEGRPRPRTRRYTLSGSWPTYTATWASVDPGSSVYVKFRLEFDNCGEGTGSVSSSSSGGSDPYVVTATLTGTLSGSPIQVNGVDYEAVETVALDCPPPPGAVRPINTCLT